MPIMRKLVKLAIGYAVAKVVARAGGPQGVLDAVMSGRAGGHDERTNRGSERTSRQKKADARRRGH